MEAAQAAVDPHPSLSKNKKKWPQIVPLYSIRSKQARMLDIHALDDGPLATVS